jgi:hypothetical protein
MKKLFQIPAPLALKQRQYQKNFWMFSLMQPNNPNALNSMFGNLIYKHRKGLHKKKKKKKNSNIGNIKAITKHNKNKT